MTLKVGVSGEIIAAQTLLLDDPRPVTGNTEEWDGRNYNGKIAPAAAYSVYGWTNLLPDNEEAFRATRREIYGYLQRATRPRCSRGTSWLSRHGPRSPRSRGPCGTGPGSKTSYWPLGGQ